jgi:hypothetical protein
MARRVFKRARRSLRMMFECHLNVIMRGKILRKMLHKVLRKILRKILCKMLRKDVLLIDVRRACN